MVTAWNAVGTIAKIRVARLLYGLLGSIRGLGGHSSRPLIVRRGGVWFDLNLAEGIDLALFLNFFEYDTRRALRRLVHPGSTVLDIGANVGAHTLFLAQMVGPQGRVIALKPTDFAFAKLARNLQLNPELAQRVTLVKAYLDQGDSEAASPAFYASWRLDQQETQHPKHLGSLVSATNAQGLTLDGFLERAGVSHVDVVKLDVDGYECRVLRGAAGMLRRDQPALVTELCPYALEEQGDSGQKMSDLLQQANDTFLAEHSFRPLPQSFTEVERFIKRESGINIVAVGSR